jgi:hypothetical protein
MHRSNGYIGVSAVGYDYGKEFYRNPGMYAMYYPVERLKYFTGVDYSLVNRNLHFFGELSLMNGKTFAMMHNISLSVNKEMEAGLGYRNYASAYRSADAMVVGLHSFPSNEQGLMIQARYAPNRYKDLWVCWDLFSSKWLTYGQKQPVRGSTLFLSFRKMDKQGNYLSIRYQRGITINTSNDKIADNILGGERSILYDVQTKIKFGINAGLYFRYALRQSATALNRCNAGMFCWGVDSKFWKACSFQWRMYVMEGATQAGGIVFHEADLGGGQQMGWLYGERTAISFQIAKTWSKNLKIGLKGQITKKVAINSFFENSAIDENISMNTQIYF